MSSRTRRSPLAVGDRVGDLEEQPIGYVEGVKGQRVLVGGKWRPSNQLIYLPCPKEVKAAAMATETGQMAAKEVDLG